MQISTRFRTALSLVLAAVTFSVAPRVQAASGSIQFKSLAYSAKESAPAASITVVRLGGSAGTVSVDFRTVAGTATPDFDYVPTNGTLTFGPGVTSLVFTVPILQDAIDELNETVTLELFNLVGPPDAVIGGQQNATLTIQDDDVCTYTLLPTGRTHEPEGGTGEFMVNATEGCHWTVIEPSTANWVAVITPSGTGSNTVQYSLDPNPSTTTRTAVLKVAGKSFTITQHGVPPPDLTKPVIVITSPGIGARLTNQPITVIGKASDAGGVVLVQARLESGAGTNAYQMTEGGTTNWSVNLTGAVPGVNLIRVRAQDASGNATEVTRSVKFVIVNQVTFDVEGNGVVTGARNGQFLDVGRSYTLTATPVPARLNLFAEWVGDKSTNNPRLTFLMETNMHFIARFVENPFIAVKGAYNGLFQNAGEARHESSGFMSVTTTDLGAFSAKMILGGRVIPFSGKFALDGRSTNTIVRPGLNPVSVKLQLHLNDLAEAITGTLADGNWNASLIADRATFSATANPAPELGRYTFAIAGDGDPARAPHGVSFGTVTVDASGRVSFAGTLADGTLTSQKVPLARDGRWPLFGRLYGGGGAILGWVHFEGRATDDMHGDVTWVKTPLASSRLYTNGFTLTTNATGAAYETSTSLLGYSEGTVAFSGGDVEPPFTNPVQVNPLNKIVNLGTNKLTFAISAPSGLFSGTVNVPGTTRSQPFKGALNIKTGVGAGFFIGPTESGRVVLQAAP